MRHTECYQYSEKELSAIVNIIGYIHHGIKSQAKKIAEITNEPSIGEMLKEIDGKLDLLQAAMPLIGPWMLSERHSVHQRWIERLSALQSILNDRDLTVKNFIDKVGHHE